MVAPFYVPCARPPRETVIFHPSTHSAGGLELKRPAVVDLDALWPRATRVARSVTNVARRRWIWYAVTPWSAPPRLVGSRESASAWIRWL